MPPHLLISSQAPADRSVRFWRVAVFVHGAVLLLGITWGFGGQSAGARAFLSLWGGIGIAMTICLGGCAKIAGPRGPARWWGRLWPLWLFDLVVVAGGLNPSFGDVDVDGRLMMVAQSSLAWWPSSARPRLALVELWQANALVLSVWNVCQVVPTRQMLVRILLFAGGNAAALAVVGTFQKLLRVEGLWFGRVSSPNPTFFSTFVYHNHWGAFALLGMAIWTAVTAAAWTRDTEGGRRSPVVIWGAVAVLLLAVTLPLSGSRSATALGGLLLAGAGGWAWRRWTKSWKGGAGSRPFRLGMALVIVAVAGMWIYSLGRRVIAERVQLTVQQIGEVRREGTGNSRWVLYRDTARMAAEKPWFGWGLRSYAHVFRWFNTQRSVERMPGRPFYAEAHSDWLQSFAEVGIVGSGLRCLLLGVLVIPALRLGWRDARVGWLLAGVAVTAVYALLEFPFACPAVVGMFWLCVFSAERIGALRDKSDVDESVESFE